MIWTGWFFISIILFRFGIKGLSRFQLNQKIYELSPEQHQKKTGTPTMGGLIMAIVFLFGVAIINQWTIEVIWIVLSAGLFFVIGAIDDLQSLKKKTNKGLSAKGKFLIQLAVSGTLIMLLDQFIRPVEFYEWFLFAFLFTGTSNATNLTDGVDGLLGSTMLVSLAGVFVVLNDLSLLNEANVVLVLMATIVMFLFFNWNPAKVFMGDSGSLMLGGFLASVCILTGQWWLLIGFGAMYVVETLSVIIQVVSFRFRKKRVFLMSPLHHHFELMGLSEVNVVLIFVVCQILFTVVQLS